MKRQTHGADRGERLAGGASGPDRSAGHVPLEEAALYCARCKWTGTFGKLGRGKAEGGLLSPHGTRESLPACPNCKTDRWLARVGQGVAVHVPEADPPQAEAEHDDGEGQAEEPLAVAAEPLPDVTAPFDPALALDASRVRRCESCKASLAASTSTRRRCPPCWLKRQQERKAGKLKAPPPNDTPPDLSPEDRARAVAVLDAGGTTKEALAAIGVTVGGPGGLPGQRLLTRGETTWASKVGAANTWLRGGECEW